MLCSFSSLTTLLTLILNTKMIGLFLSSDQISCLHQLLICLLFPITQNYYNSHYYAATAIQYYSKLSINSFCFVKGTSCQDSGNQGASFVHRKKRSLSLLFPKPYSIFMKSICSNTEASNLAKLNPWPGPVENNGTN